MTRPDTSSRVPPRRSAKQKENARGYAERTFAEAKIVFGPLKGSGFPRESWWTEVRDRDGFTAKARAERERIVNSRFHAVTDPTYREG
jgi:hypothetical protein